MAAAPHSLSGELPMFTVYPCSQSIRRTSFLSGELPRVDDVHGDDAHRVGAMGVGHRIPLRVVGSSHARKNAHEPHSRQHTAAHGSRRQQAAAGGACDTAHTARTPTLPLSLSEPPINLRRHSRQAAESEPRPHGHPQPLT
eukprot:2064010-Prymnesium_polylepis.1